VERQYNEYYTTVLYQEPHLSTFIDEINNIAKEYFNKTYFIQVQDSGLFLRIALRIVSWPEIFLMTQFFVTVSNSNGMKYFRYVVTKKGFGQALDRIRFCRTPGEIPSDRNFLILNHPSRGPTLPTSGERVTQAK
jgi:hypothetical protein